MTIKNLSTRYVITFLIIGFLVTIGFLSIERQIAAQEHDSRVINIAGRQRMLSQKITKETLLLESSSKTPNSLAIKNLTDTLNLFQISHDALRDGDIELDIEPNYNQDILNAYNDLELTFNIITESTKRIIAMHVSNSSNYNFDDLLEEILTAEKVFLEKMNAIVFMHDDEAQSRIFRTEIITYLIGTGLVLTIIILWFAILRPALKETEEIDKTKSEFILLTSHKLRTPLSGINWISEVLQTGEVGQITDEQKELVEQIHMSSERMVSFINSLLYIAEIDLDQFQVQNTNVNLKNLVNKVAEKYSTQIKNKEQTLTLNVPDELPELITDEKLITIILSSLLGNAILYTPSKGQLSLTVNYEKGTALFTVTDSGIGITAAEQNKIFTKLFRGERAIKIDTDGAGLSLFITQYIVQSLGGEITFQSKENEGTTFMVSVPMVESKL